MPLARMEYGSLGQCYVLLKREAGSMTLGKLGACMQFTVKEIDPSTGDALLRPKAALTDAVSDCKSQQDSGYCIASFVY